MSEHDQQVAVVEWCDLKGIPVFAIPNGGMRHKRTVARRCATYRLLFGLGIRTHAGVPDQPQTTRRVPSPLVTAGQRLLHH